MLLSLSNEIILKILIYINSLNFKNIFSTCKSLNKFKDCDLLWKNRCNQEYPSSIRFKNLNDNYLIFLKKLKSYPGWTLELASKYDHLDIFRWILFIDSRQRYRFNDKICAIALINGSINILNFMLKNNMYNLEIFTASSASLKKAIRCPITDLNLSLNHNSPDLNSNLYSKTDLDIKSKSNIKSVYRSISYPMDQTGISIILERIYDFIIMNDNVKSVYWLLSNKNNIKDMKIGFISIEKIIYLNKRKKIILYCCERKYQFSIDINIDINIFNDIWDDIDFLKFIVDLGYKLHPYVITEILRIYRMRLLFANSSSLRNDDNINKLILLFEYLKSKDIFLTAKNRTFINEIESEKLITYYQNNI